MDAHFNNVYDDPERARAYADLGFPGTYYLAFRDLPALLQKHVSGTRALDFGCGTGRSSRFLRQLHFDVVGVDLSEQMLAQARERDPHGDYRWLADGNLTGFESASLDLILAAFTFDNTPDREKLLALRQLRDLLAPSGRLVVVASSPAIYWHEWASFSTRDYPGNRSARDGESVRIIMLDVTDRRPVIDILCSDAHYRELFRAASLSVLENLEPLATGSEPVRWVNETRIAPWMLYMLCAS